MAGKPDMILHTDGDGFFAAVERAQYPSLKSKPVVVGEERGIVIAATYEAKRLGINRSMLIGEVKQQFPEVTILPSHFELYEMYSEKLAKVLERFALEVEVYSIDECFATISSKELQKAGSPEKYLRAIKTGVQNELGITFSFGLASTKVLAKVASKFEKPDGCTVILPGKHDSYLKSTPIERVWGIGYRSAPKLKLIGIFSAHDFVQLPLGVVEDQFARPFVELWHELKGTRIYEVKNNTEPPQSLQATRTFTPASKDPEYIFSELSKNVEVSFERLRGERMRTRGLSFFIKTSEFTYRSQELLLSYATDNPGDVLGLIEEGFRSIFSPRERYRASGVTLHLLEGIREGKRDLFGEQDFHTNKNTFLTSVDAIKAKHGTRAIGLASSLQALAARKYRRQASGDQYVHNLPFPYLGEVT